MYHLFKLSLFNKTIAAFVALGFVSTIFTCFSLATNEMHTAQKHQMCETVMSIADNGIVQSGFTFLLLMFVSVLLLKNGFGSSFSEIKQQLYNRYCHHLLNQKYCFKGYSYLSLLFSSGILHSKLHNVSC